MKESETSLRDFFPSVLISAALSVAVGAAVMLILSCFILFAGDPARLFLPAGLVSLYAAAASGGVLSALKSGRGVAAGLICGGILTLAVVIARLFAAPSASPRPEILNVSLAALIPAFSAAGAAVYGKIGGRRKRKRPSLRRRSGVRVR